LDRVFGSRGVLMVMFGSVAMLVTIAAGARCIVEKRDLVLSNDVTTPNRRKWRLAASGFV
jgi:hypothetical protein